MTDVLIVGSGSAGSVLAERLSTDRSCRVTVVEAGPGLDDPKVRALTEDGLALPIGPASPVVRRFDTRLTEHPPRSAELVRGACFGGSGAINGGYFCRASPADFEALGWSWAEVVEHYQAVEDRIGPAATDAFSRVTAEFVHDAQAAGYRWLPDLNAAPVGANAPPGIAAVPLNIIEGRRRGPGSVFLKSALDRPNLSVLTGTRVTWCAPPPAGRWGWMPSGRLVPSAYPPIGLCCRPVPSDRLNSCCSRESDPPVSCARWAFR